MPQWLSKAGTIVLEWLYPPRCGLCGRIGRIPLCDECKDDLPVIDWANPNCLPPISYHYALFEYSGRGAQAVRRLKFERTTALAAPLAELVLLGCEKFDLLTSDYFIPVPIHKTRQNVRGFNQSVLLSEKLPKSKVRPDLLTRNRATKPQVLLSREERLTNLKGAFTASPEVCDKTILLIDDVYTSGGTAAACAEALIEAGAIEVGVLTLATGASIDNHYG